jgi:ABC-type transport system involved in multi-copper enzyme maturation permease subunit
MRLIWAVAGNTFRETIRDRILYNLLFFALALIGTAWVVSSWSLGQELRVLKNIGLSVMSLFGLLMAIFIGIGLVYKEIDRRTIYVILSRPMRRWMFLSGKYIGLQFTLLLNFCIMTLGLHGALTLYGAGVDGPMLIAVGFTFLEMMVMMAFALLFSAITTPTLSAMFSIAVYIGGHLSTDIMLLGAGIAEDDLFEMIIRGLHYVIPNLEYFNFRVAIVHQLPLHTAELWQALCYGLAYTAGVLMLAMGIFERRNFK